MPRSASPPPRRTDSSRSHRLHDDEAERDRRHRDRARDGGRDREYNHASSSSSQRYDDDRYGSSSRRHDRDRSYKENGSGSSRRERDDEERHRHRSSRRDDDDRDRDRRSSHRSRRSYDSEDDERRSRKRAEKKARHRDETSQERRERKLAKKAAKTGMTAEELALQRTTNAEAMMYSAGDNPFNDASLGQQFKWGKKEEKEKKAGMTPAEARARDEIRRKDAQEEIARLAAVRAQREKDQALREEEEAKMARLAESAAMSAWIAKEDDFHLEQSQRRAAIRIRENRAKPIDLLAMNLRWADGDRMSQKRTDDDEDDDEAGLEIDLDEPYEIFEALSLEETEELHRDIQMYLSLEKNEQNQDFWRSMIIVCDDQLAEMRAAEAEADTRGAGRPKLDPTVKHEINLMLSTKTYPQLAALQDQVRGKLQSGEPIDVEYWEQLLKSIVVWRAKAKLRDLHEIVLENRLEYLRRKQRDEASRQQEELVAQLDDEDEDTAQDAVAEAAATTESGDEEEWSAEMEPPAVDESRLSYDDRRLPVYTWQSLKDELVAARRKVLGASFVPRARVAATETDNVDTSEALFAAEAAKGIDVSEEAFNGPSNEAPLPSSSAQAGAYDWEDKYRPRKPRYFNRVHTGFEWNKYNQTHYDSDNPPPKIVQGYKFNIFYPDLIDKSSAPTYKLIKEPGNDETVIIKFEAGAPYEDLAFRIVNRPWQYSHKRGFRSSFDRGILQLYFNFQRNFYRK